MKDMKLYETSDIGIAAYVMMRGLKLKDASRGVKSRFSFVFEDPKKALLANCSVAFVLVGFCVIVKFS